MSTLIEYSENAISKYGVNGDNSFEFIGVNIDNSISYKAYRKRSEDAIEYLKNTVPYSKLFELFTPTFLAENQMDICDFSKGKFQELETFRIVFLLGNNQNIQQAEACVNNFLSRIKAESYIPNVINTTRVLQDYMGTEKSLLMQLGIEVDENCNLIGIKYYVSIKSSNNILSIERLMEALLPDNISEHDKIREIVEFLQRQEYELIFVGFNMYDNIIEPKLYFKSQAFGFQTKKIVEHTNNVIQKFNLTHAISKEDVKNLFEMNLFVRGIAIDLDALQKWRLYINALPRTVV